MSLKLRYALFIIIIHLLLGGLFFYVLRERRILFLLVEGLLLVSLYFSYQIYRSFIQPLEFITGGIDAIRDQDFNVKFVPTKSYEVNKLVYVYNEMIDNIRQERVQGKEQHFFLQRLIEASPTGIMIFDFDHRIIQFNPRAGKLLDIEGMKLPHIIWGKDSGLLQEIAKLEPGESRVLHEEGINRYKCECSEFIDQGFSRKFVIIQELSAEIIAAEKRAYGKVIRMMAHEVNNSIGAINSILQTFKDNPQERDDPQWSEDLQQMLPIAIERNEQLNRFMQNFAKVVRLPAPNLEVLDLNGILKKIAQLMQTRLSANNIVIELDLHPTPLNVRLDSQQLEQVLINIIQNAQESIGHDGHIKIRSQLSPIGFTVADNGPGLEPEIAENLFSPFFTTKPTGQGIGLTLVRDILQNHECRFSLRTEEDDWTHFRVEWPIRLKV